VSSALNEYHQKKIAQIARESISLLPGELVETVSQLGYDWVTQLQWNINNITIEDLKKMSRDCEISSRAGKILSLRARSVFGDYNHADKKTYRLSWAGRSQTIQEWVRSNFQSMEGDLNEKIAMCFEQAVHFGHGVAEIVSTHKADGYPFEHRLDKLKVLPIDRYYFAGRQGEIDRIIYHPLSGGQRPIPIQKLLVIYNPRADEPEDLYGDCAIARAYPFYRLRRTLWKMVGVAGLNYSIGRTIYKVQSEKQVQLFDSDGKPSLNIDGTPKTGSAGRAVAAAVKNAAAGDPLILDKNVDTLPLTVPSGEGFFNTILPLLTKQIWTCYGIPSTIMDDTNQGLGNSGLNQGHREVLDNQIAGMLMTSRSQTIEKIVRPLLDSNFGAVIKDYGSFGEPKFLDPNLRSMRVSNLMQGVMQGLASPDDLDVVNVYREDIGLSPISSEDWELKQYQLAMLAQQQQQQPVEQQHEY